MLNIARKFDFNETLSKEGVRVPIGDGIVLYIAREGNERYRNALGNLLVAYREEFSSGDLEDDVLTEMTAKAMAEGILVNWEGVKDEDTGEEVPYSPEMAYELLTKFPELREQVLMVSRNNERYLNKHKEQSVKN